MGSEKAVKRMLDQLGRTADVELLTMFNHLFNRYMTQYPGEPVGFLKYLCGGLTITYDAMIVRKAMCRELKGGTSDILSIARSGFVTPIAPKWLDVEISKYVPEIAAECGVDNMTALKYYIFKVQPYIKMVDETKLPHLKEIMAKIKDPKDAPYVVVHFEHKSLGLVTYDKKVIEYMDGQQCFEIKDLANINIVFRKEYVAIGFGLINIALFMGILAGAVRIFKSTWKYLLGTIAITGLVLLLLRQFKRDTYNLIVGRMGEVFGDAKHAAFELWKAIRPFVIDYMKECLERSKAFDENMKSLARTGGGIKKVEGAQLTYADVIRMLMLATENKPIREKSICALFADLGYTVKGKRMIIRRVLKESGLFERMKNGTYKLIPPVVRCSEMVVA